MERTIHFTLVDQVSTLNRITSAFVRLQTITTSKCTKC